MGLLTDLIGNAAITGHGMLTRQIAADDAEAAKVRDEGRANIRRRADYDYQADSEQKRQRFLQELRASTEERRALAKQQQRAKDSQQIEAEAADLRTAKDVNTANKVAPSVDDSVMDFIKATLPADKVKAVYGVQESTPVSQLDDQIGVARQHGFYESENGLRADRRVVLSELNANRAEDNREKRTVLLEKRIDGNQDLAERRLKQDSQRYGMAHPPAVVATMEYLKKLGWDEARIEAFVTQKKKLDPNELAAKLTRREKNGDAASEEPGARKPRRSLEGDGAHMDAQGNVRDVGGNLIYVAKRKPGMQPLDNRPPSTQADVDAFNAAMAAKAKPEPSLMERLFNVGAGK